MYEKRIIDHAEKQCSTFHDRQVDAVSRYLASQEKHEAERRIGVEFEHFILDSRSLEAVSYFGKAGVKETLAKIQSKGWQREDKDGHFLALEKDGTTITLEPGGQIELSIKPLKMITEIEGEYLQFLCEVIPILEDQKQILVCMGYHPQSKIVDIPFVPTAGNRYISRYLQSRGRLGINMMKGTASMQVSVDYTSESDYSKKLRVANRLSPFISVMFDNSPFFEGELWKKNCLRTFIWKNCDSRRCGLPKGALEDGFGYSDYAKYMLNVPPIFIEDGKSIRYTGQTLFSDLFDCDNHGTAAIENMLSKMFPDVRTKQYIEIRMADSVPYPLNIAGAALWKGLMYNDQSLEKTDNLLSGLGIIDLQRSKNNVIDAGLKASLAGRSLHDFGTTILALARQGLDESERDYLIPIEEILNQGKNPAAITRERLSTGKAKAIEWCSMNSITSR